MKTIPPAVDVDELQGIISGIDLAEAKFEQHKSTDSDQPMAIYKVDEDIPAMLDKYKRYKTLIGDQINYVYEINDDTSVHEDENKRIAKKGKKLS